MKILGFEPKDLALCILADNFLVPPGIWVCLKGTAWKVIGPGFDNSAWRETKTKIEGEINAAVTP